MSNSINDIYGGGSGGFLKARDIEEKTTPFFWIRSATVVKKVFREEEGEKQMIELRFFETPDNPLSSKLWSLNKTQAGVLEDLYGSYENWAFKGVLVARGKTKDRSGNEVATITVQAIPYEMDDNIRAGAEKVLQAEREGSQFTGATPSAPPVALPTPPPFTPPTTGFAPPSTESDPTSNW